MRQSEWKRKTPKELFATNSAGDILSSQPPPVSRGEVHVWCVTLSSWTAWREDLASTLADDERARATRFRFPQDRDRFLITRALLRRQLGGYFRVAPEAIELSYGEYGKPTLSTPASLQFNVSHTRDRALLAFSREEVGVDVERVRDDLPLQQLAEIAFSPSELYAWRALPADAARDAFFSTWTAKEAYLKARGLGLQGELRSITYSADSAWSIVQLDLGESHAGAIATRPASNSVIRFELEVPTSVDRPFPRL